MKHVVYVCLVSFVFLFCTGVSHAQNCAGLPTQFSGNEFPSGDFFSNFQNPCYTIPLAPQGKSKTDLNDTYWQMFYKVDPRYQLIIVGNFPNARYFSLTANDDHYLLSQTILDTNIVPLTSSFVNPYQPGIPYASGQQYAVAMNFGGTPGTIETGCMTSAYNVDVNSLDATLRHQGMNWNTDPGFFQQVAGAPVHVVDTPQHTNPPVAGYLMVRAYLDINAADPTTIPSVIVRDVASGCAYPAAYALNTLQVVSPNGGNSWLNQSQLQGHESYDSTYLPTLCYGTDPQNSLSWARDGEFVKFPNPHSSYLKATVPTNLPTTLAAAGEVMRFRLKLPTTPPTPCTNGCSRSGNEEMRYVGLSFYPPSGDALLSLADSAFVKDANGYATLIVGTGAAIPAWVTAANGYTYLDLTTISGYNNLATLQIRDILPATTFACGVQVVPYKTSVYSPDGNMIGDYLPEVDYPLAASLPQVATELIGPSACGVLPAGVPAVSPSCGVLPANPTAITGIPAPAAGEDPVAVQPLPPITLTGSGFGFLPDGESFTGNSSYLQITDVTQNWSAGLTGDLCNLSVGYWADDRIEVVANVNQYGVCPLAAGDQLNVSLWNPQSGNAATSSVTVTPDVSYALGTSSVLVGSAAGNGSVALITTGPWTATSNASWLHLSSVNTSGVGGTLIVFAFDANTSANAQTGTLTIAGLTFTVTQAGTSYAPVAPVTQLTVSGLNAPQGVALDAQGNLYIADTGNRAIKKWIPGTQAPSTLVSGLSTPTGVAVDTNGNVYIADSGSQSIQRWSPVSQQLTPMATGLVSPFGVAVDNQGDVFFSDCGSNSIQEWNVSSASLVTLASALNDPTGLSADRLGNVYFANTGSDAIVQWNIAAQAAAIPVSSGTLEPLGVAVDGQGNIDFSDTGSNSVLQWNAANQQLVTWVSSGLNHPAGVALDAQGNLYVADQNNNAIKKVSFAYLSLSALSLNEGVQAGADSVTAQVIPASTVITAVSDQTWLAVTSVAGGNIAFTFQTNTTGASRVAHLSVIGQQVTITQAGDALASLTKSAGDGQSTTTGQLFPIGLQVTVTDNNGIPLHGLPVTFAVVPGAGGAGGTFNTSPPMPILSDQNGNAVAPALMANNIGGSFSVIASVEGFSVTFALTNLVYSLASSQVTVGSAAGSASVLLLAGGPWSAVSNSPWLTIATGSQSGAGNQSITFSYAANLNATPQTGTLTIGGLTFTVTQAPATYMPANPVTTVVSSGLQAPRGMAIDAQGNVYIADSLNNAIEVLNATSHTITTLVSGLNRPSGVAVDRLGNVYIADTNNNAIKKWTASSQTVTTLASVGLSLPVGIAVDSSGNVYFSDSGNNSLKEWLAVSATVTTLVSSTMRTPLGIALDAFGNIYVADSKNKAVKEWYPATKQFASLVSTKLSNPYGIAVDGDGNVYIADSGNNTVKVWNPATSGIALVAAAGLSGPSGVAVNGTGTTFIADTNNNAIKKVTPDYVLLSSSTFSEGQSAGTGSLTTQVFPASTPLTATSAQPWLTVTGAANGLVSFSFTANNTVNTRTGQLTVAGAQVTITQSPDTVASIVKTAGTGQSAPVGQPFATALQVKVKDAAGNAVGGAAVTFKVVPGTTDASGTFNSSPRMPVITNSSGLATAPVLTANNIAGTFTVTVTVGTLKASFTLTNTPQ